MNKTNSFPALAFELLISMARALAALAAIAALTALAALDFVLVLSSAYTKCIEGFCPVSRLWSNCLKYLS